MKIAILYNDGKVYTIPDVKNYDFYPETRTLFVERSVDDESYYVPITDKVKTLQIVGGTERGYLEGHDEAR